MNIFSQNILDELQRNLDTIEKQVKMVGSYVRIDPYIVEHSQAAREAKTRIYDLRRQDTNRAITRQLLNKHGSRQQTARKPRNKRSKLNDHQLSLGF